MRIKSYYVYIITNRYNTVFYVGMTNNLLRRISEHQKGVYQDSFSQRYNVYKLVYYEITTMFIVLFLVKSKLKVG